MDTRFVSITLAAFLLSACKPYEGTYSPSCVAFAGDTIQLSNGQFVWEKFTDAVQVDEDGNVLNQFPGYPMRGTYNISAETVTMETASGEALDSMYLLEDEGRYYLLSGKQSEEFRATGKHAECPLILGGHRGS